MSSAPPRPLPAGWLSSNPREGEAYLRYLAYADRLFRITSPAFIYGDPPGLRSLLRFSPLDLLGIDGLRTMDRSIGRRVFTAHLRQLLDRFATYVGADPYQAPATLNVIAHVELNQGVWFPVGGIYSIAQALTDAAEAMGVEIRLGTRSGGFSRAAARLSASRRTRARRWRRKRLSRTSTPLWCMAICFHSSRASAAWRSACGVASARSRLLSCYWVLREPHPRLPITTCCSLQTTRRNSAAYSDSERLLKIRRSTSPSAHAPTRLARAAGMRELVRPGQRPG